MKYIVLMVLLSATFCVPAWSQSRLESPEGEIKRILTEETNAMTSQSMADIARQYWILDKQTVRIVTFYDGFTLQQSAEDMLTMTEVPPAGHATVSISDIQISLVGQIATVIYTQTIRLSDTNFIIPSTEMRIMHCDNGTWRTHLQSAHQAIIRN
jgi:hypothetical protein